MYDLRIKKHTRMKFTSTYIHTMYIGLYILVEILQDTTKMNRITLNSRKTRFLKEYYL